jgi:hypothetical protein
MINIANCKYSVFLKPEKFYYNRVGKLMPEWMIEAVFEAFQHQHVFSNELTVHEFMAHSQ